MKLNVQFIKKNLDETGMTGTDLAYLCDVSIGYISRLLNHKEIPSPKMMQKLMEIFDVPYSQITIKGAYREEELIRGNKNNKIYCDKLISMMEDNGMNQKMLAKIFKVSGSYVSTVCIGKEHPSDMILSKICATFDIHPNDILVNKISDNKARRYMSIKSW